MALHLRRPAAEERAIRAADDTGEGAEMTEVEVNTPTSMDEMFSAEGEVVSSDIDESSKPEVEESKAVEPDESSKAAEESTGEENAEPPSGHVPVSALQDERRKRQEAEAALARATAPQPEAAVMAPNQPARPDSRRYPEGAAQWDKDTAENTRVNSAWDVCARTINDFNNVMGAPGDPKANWSKLVAREPHLYGLAIKAVNPAHFAYTVMKDRLLLQEVGGDLGKYREKIIAEHDEKSKADGGRTEIVENPEPESLADESSVAARGKQKWAGPTDLDVLLPPGN
jgi:hypothetical protein